MISDSNQAETDRAEAGHLSGGWTDLDFGGGRLVPAATPRRGSEHPIRPASVASFAAGANVCHSVPAGDDGLIFSGTTHASRITHLLLRRDALFFKGFGVLIPVEHVGFVAET